MDQYGYMAVGWLIAMIILVIIEFATQGLTTIWFAVGCIFGLFGAAIEITFLWQLILAVIVSCLMFIFTRPVLLKYVNKRLIKTNVETVVGQTCICKETINNLEATGAVLLNGIEWTARTANNNDIIEAETKVVVKSIEGVKLIVARAN